LTVKEFRELEDCEICPLYNDLCSGGMTSDHRGEPVEPPCVYWDDDENVEDVCRAINTRILEREEYYDRKYKEEQERKAKNAEATKKRREASWYVRNETRQIKSLKKRILGYEAAIRLADTIRIVGNMMEGTMSNETERKLHPLEAEIATLRVQIVQLEAIRKQKLKDLRQKRKEF
jgi:hypothetical protein